MIVHTGACLPDPVNPIAGLRILAKRVVEAVKDNRSGCVQRDAFGAGADLAQHDLKSIIGLELLYMSLSLSLWSAAVDNADSILTKVASDTFFESSNVMPE